MNIAHIAIFQCGSTLEMLSLGPLLQANIVLTLPDIISPDLTGMESDGD